MLQALEWEEASPPSGSSGPPAAAAAAAPADKKGGGSGSSGDRKGGRSGSGAAEEGSGAAGGYENPSKHVVYRPTALGLLSILTTTVEVLPRDGLLLLYLSAGGGRGELRGAGGAGGSTSDLT